MGILTSAGLDMKSRICIEHCVTQERDQAIDRLASCMGNVGNLHSRQFKTASVGCSKPR